MQPRVKIFDCSTGKGLEENINEYLAYCYQEDKTFKELGVIRYSVSISDNDETFSALIVTLHE